MIENPAQPELFEALTHLKFAHGLNTDARLTDTIGDLCIRVGAILDNIEAAEPKPKE